MKVGVRHGKLASRKESLMVMEDNKLRLKAIYCAAQVICFDHVSARKQVQAANLPKNIVA
eukprot:6198994-Pleurochrysis_carterae.AAC.1